MSKAPMSKYVIHIYIIFFLSPLSIQTTKFWPSQPNSIIRLRIEYNQNPSLEINTLEPNKKSPPHQK